ncbi:hypothetical protein K438DRAFT_200614 [Mycena galopus ATCC 62051]|nr:hypothetical protein K438DRAFT_200614 [Mycena galopus ATCC 62051]
MTDTVGFVLQLLDTALKAREYIQDFRNATKDQQKLLSEMENLRQLLEELRNRITANPSSSFIQKMDSPLTTLKCAMEKLTRMLRPSKGGRVARFGERLAWILWNKQEASGCLDEFERFKSLLNSWLILDWGHTTAISSTVPGHDNALEATIISHPVLDAPQSTKPRSVPPLRATTIAATAWPGGMYVYCQNGDGGMHEGCLHQDVNNITRDQMALLHARGWRYGALKGSCAAGSALCGMSWGSPPNRAIFYQTDDKAIRQMSCCDGQDWHTSGFAQTDVMPGTQMTEVHNENADRVVLFFQDKDGFLCRRRAIDWCWEDAVRLCKAAPLTPISATTWSETEDIRVYFQDQHNVFREFQGSFDGAWTMGDFALRSNKIHRSVAAISWLRSEMKPGPEIRVYIQDHTNTVIEWYYSVNSEWTL